MKKRRSKISIQIEEIENKRKESGEFNQELNDNMELEEYDKKLSENSKIYEKNENKFVKFDVFFYFTLKNKEFVFQIKTDFFNKNEQYIYELIKNIVKKINEKNIVINYNNANYIVSLKDCDDYEDNDKRFYMDNYEIKQCNIKNLTPLDDTPSFSSDSLIKNIERKKLSFVYKTPLNIMIREKIESKEENNKYQLYYDED
jgi:hypothetical protein